MGKNDEKDRKLNAKQQAFVQEYAVDKNGTQAAIRAGYSPKTAQEQASVLLSKPMIKASVEALLAKLAEETYTNAAWVRRRLKEESEDYSEFASHAARIKAVELIGKMNGDFEKDNTQKGGLDRPVSVNIVLAKNENGHTVRD